MPQVSVDSRAVLIDGKRTLLISGAIHYPRSTLAMWPALLDLSRQAGLNCIETYVMWEGHEHCEGRYDFTGRFDLGRFLALCAERDLYVILRMGPYICAEWNFGGFPPYLLRLAGMHMRTHNQAFMESVRRWFRVLIAKVGDYLASRGGPIILVQVENEYKIVARRYGEQGRKYLEWIAQMARGEGIGVPIIMCEGAAPGTIETVNDFVAHHRVERQKRKRPDAPVLWTELWTGWYDVWGCRHHMRDGEEIAYSVLRFFAAGGAGVNYYMWHGGTNFGRSAMFLQTTSYDFDAPIDEYGLPTTKLAVLGAVHRALLAHSRVLLEGKREEPSVIEERDGEPVVLVERWTTGSESLAFLVNAGENARTVEYRDARHEMPGRSAVMLVERTGAVDVACRSWRDERIAPVVRTMERREKVLDWEMIEEPIPGGEPCPLRPSRIVEKPVNQLDLTADETDYCWYCCSFEAQRADELELEIRGCCDIVYVFVNGRFVAASRLPLVQDRGSFDSAAYCQRFFVPADEGCNRLAILAVALGLVKGDWMIDSPMENERKGIWGEVLLDGRRLDAKWTMIAGLLGEKRRLWQPGPSSMAPWRPISTSENPLRWYRTRINFSDDELAAPAPWAVDASGLGKGYLWINGKCLGRYWLIIGRDEPTDHLKNPLIRLGPTGVPTQRYYHVPREWLAARNELVIFEEQGALPNDVHLSRRR